MSLKQMRLKMYKCTSNHIRCQGRDFSFSCSSPLFAAEWNNRFSACRMLHFLPIYQHCVGLPQSPRSPGHSVRSLATGRKLSRHPRPFCWRGGGRLWMPQRWGKPGSVTTATHTGQPVKSLLKDTWVALGGESTGGMLKEPLIKGQEQEVFFSICVYLGHMTCKSVTPHQSCACEHRPQEHLEGHS